jgi:antitoxin FitA
MKPYWLEIIMPTTLTLKNIPDHLYDQLKQSAQVNRRSMNNEAIMCLESILMSAQALKAQNLKRARQLRLTLPEGEFLAYDIDAMKQEGRP